MMKHVAWIAGVFLVLHVSPSRAQEIDYDPAAVETLTSPERKEIEGILRSHRLLDDTMTPRTAAFEDRLKLPKLKIRLPDPRKDLCKAACDVSAASAIPIAGCSALSGGAAIAVCTAAAAAARDSCKRGC